MAQQYTGGTTGTPPRNTESTTNRTTDTSYRNRDVEDDKVSLTSPMDRVRWSSVLAGLFTFFAALILFTVLGIALGLSTFDAQNPRSFGIGAGIYGAVSAIIAFGLGGFIAARTTAVAGTGNAVLNGAMVWIVAIPLIVNFLTAGVGSLLGTATDLATSAAQTAAEVAAPAVDEAVDQAQQNPDAVQDAAGAVQGAVEGAQAQIDDISAQDVENAARDASGAAWGTLLALGLSALAAIGGGMLGRRTYPTDIAVWDTGDQRQRSYS
jgi:ABC-type multidrug transport system fused ATPase/permease subunit